MTMVGVHSDSPEGDHGNEHCHDPHNNEQQLPQVEPEQAMKVVTLIQHTKHFPQKQSYSRAH